MNFCTRVRGTAPCRTSTRRRPPSCPRTPPATRGTGTSCAGRKIWPVSQEKRMKRGICQTATLEVRRSSSTGYRLLLPTNTRLLRGKRSVSCLSFFCRFHSESKTKKKTDSTVFTSSDLKIKKENVYCCCRPFLIYLQSKCGDCKYRDIIFLRFVHRACLLLFICLIFYNSLLS